MSFSCSFPAPVPPPVFPLSHTEHAVSLNLYRIYYLTFHCSACSTCWRVHFQTLRNAINRTSWGLGHLPYGRAERLTGHEWRKKFECFSLGRRWTIIDSCMYDQLKGRADKLRSRIKHRFYRTFEWSFGDIATTQRSDILKGNARIHWFLHVFTLHWKPKGSFISTEQARQTVAVTNYPSR